MDGWNTQAFPIGVNGLFSGAFAVSFREGKSAKSMQSDFVEFFFGDETSSQKSTFESGSVVVLSLCWGECVLKPCGSNDSGKNCNFCKLYLLGSKNVESQIPKFIGLDSEIFSLGESWGDFSWQLLRFYVFGELSSGQKWQEGGSFWGFSWLQRTEFRKIGSCAFLNMYQVRPASENTCSVGFCPPKKPCKNWPGPSEIQ